MPLNNPGASTAPLSSPAPASPSMRGFTAPVTAATPQGALGRDQHRIRIDFERRDAEPIKMRGPGYMIGEESVRVVGQASDHRAGKGALAHIGQRLGIDDIITMARTQQFEEVAAALRLGGSKPGEVC